MTEIASSPKTSRTGVILWLKARLGKSRAAEKTGFNCTFMVRFLACQYQQFQYTVDIKRKASNSRAILENG
jgi:hypothetical protein